MPELSVARFVAHCLYLNSVKRIYGIIGTSVLDFFDALYDYRAQIKFITTRHEQVAVSAADAEARITGNIGVAVVHAGPGFLNSIISLGIAMKDRIPLLLITGGVRRRLKGTDAWLEVEQEDIAKPIVKAYFRINTPVETPSIMKEVFDALSKTPKGPVILEVPEDNWNEKVSFDEHVFNELRLREMDAGTPKRENIKEISDKLLNAKRPLILACGELTLNKGYREELLERLLQKTGAYLITSGNGRGAISEENERNLGRAGYGGGNLVADSALESCDFLLVLGNEFDDITTYAYTLLPEGEAIAVSKDDSMKKRPSYFELIDADPFSFLEYLNKEIENRNSVVKPEWDERINGYRKKWRAMLEEAIARKFEGRVNVSRFFKTLDDRLPRNRIVTGGQGVHILYAYDYLKIYRPRSFLAATNLGAMGYAFPAAIGAKLASKEDEVIAVLGDGDFMMTIQDLETVKRENIALKMIIVNDNSYRVLYQRQAIQKQGRIYETLLQNPDFVKLANSFGISAMRITSDEEIIEAVNKLVETKDPFLLEIVCDPNDLPPLNLKQTLEMSM